MRFFTVFFAATCLFGQAIPEKAWTTLAQGVHDTNPLKRLQAVTAMTVLHPEARVTTLLEPALDDKVAAVRVAACDVLGQMKDRTAIPKLQTALSDKVGEVVFAAAKALYAMGDPQGRAVMQAILLGEQPDASGFVSGGIRDMKLKLHDPTQVLLLSAESAVGILVPGGGAIGPVGEGLMKDKQASGQTVAALLLATDSSPIRWMRCGGHCWKRTGRFARRRRGQWRYGARGACTTMSRPCWPTRKKKYSIRRPRR